MGSFFVSGWGTWIRTTIDGVRDRCPAVRRSPMRGAQHNSTGHIRQCRAGNNQEVD